MRLRCASASQFIDCVHDDRAVRCSSPSSEIISFLIRPLFSGFLFFVQIPLIPFSLKTRKSLSE